MKRKTIGIWILLYAIGSGTSLPAQETLQSPSGRILGITGSSPEQPIGEVRIEVRRSYAALATWSYWRGAPLPTTPIINGRSDKQGRFSIPVDPGHEYEVRFFKAGYKNSKSIVYTNRPFLGFLEQGTTSPPEKPETPAADLPIHVHGLVKDAQTGTPIANASLREFWGKESIAHSTKDGEFTLHCNRKQAENDLLVWAPGYQLGVFPQTAFDKKERAVIELRTGLGLRGKLVDSEGKPQAGLWVVLGTDVPVGEETTYGDVALWKQTDSEGRFEFAALAKGWRYWLRTMLLGGTPVEIAQGVMQEGSRDLGAIRAVASFSVEGRVFGPNAKPLPGGRVHVLRLFDGEITKLQIVRTTPSFPIDAQGRFRIPGLASYPHELCFFLEGLEHAIRVVKPPKKGSTVQLDVQMGFGRSLRGIVVDAEGKAVDGALLRGMVWSDRDIFPLVPNGDISHNGRFIAGNMRVLTHPDGTFLLERLRSKLPLRIVCSKEGLKTVKLRLPATPSKTPLRIVLR